MALRVKESKAEETKAPETNVNTEAEKAVATATAEAPVSAEEGSDAEYGSKSDTLIFLRSVGDPSKDDTDTDPTKIVDGKAATIHIPTKVGYVFKCTEDIEVPDIALGDKFTTDHQMFYKEGTLGNTRKVKAGEEFILTKLEAGTLLSRPEYNGCATGGQYPVSVVYSFKGMKSSNGQKLQTSDSVMPGVSLKARGNWGSINRLPIDPVLTFDREKGKAGQMRCVNKKIIPGYEKFEVLCRVQRRVGTGSAGSAASNVNVRNKNAAAFLSIFEKKKGAK